MRRLRRWITWVIALGALSVVAIPLVPPALVSATDRPAPTYGRTPLRPTRPTPHTPTDTPTATPTSPPADTPTATSVERCGRYGCAIVTPAPTGDAAPPTATVTPPTGPAPTTISVSCDWTDPGSWVPCLLAAAENMVNGWLNDIDSGLSLLNIWSATAPALTYDNPTVIHYWAISAVIAGAFLLLMLAGLSIEIVLGARWGQVYSGALERFWRVLLVVAWVAASRVVIGQAIDLSNDALAILDAAQQQPLFDLAVQGHLVHAALLEGALWIVDGVMEILLLLVMLMRLALLDVLIVLAPLGLLCYGWPRLQGWAHLWSRLFAATLLTQFIQIAALRLGEDLVSSGSGTIGAVSTVSDDVRTVLQFLIGIAVFVVVLRVPRMLNNHGGHAATPLALALWAARTIGTGGSSVAAQASPPAVSVSSAGATASPSAISTSATPPLLSAAGGTGGVP